MYFLQIIYKLSRYNYKYICATLFFKNIFVQCNNDDYTMNMITMTITE